MLIHVHLEKNPHMMCHQVNHPWSGFMIYMNVSLIIWYSKKESTIKSSVFGAEFVAMKDGIKTLQAIQYKLRMMGIPISRASYVLEITCPLSITAQNESQY